MTVSAVVPRVRYVGAGTAGPFGFGWRADNKNQLKVVKVVIATGAETVLTVDVNYTVGGLLNPAGGTITLVGATLGNGTEALVIVANLELEQGLTLSDHNDFPAPTVEQRLDWMTRMFQRSYDLHGRSLVLYETDIWGQGEFNGGGNRIANVAEPVGDNDVVTLAWHEGTWVPQLNAIVADAQGAADEASTYLAGVAANAAAAAASAADALSSASAAALSAANALASANAAALAAAQPGTSFIAVRSNPYASLQNINAAGETDQARAWMWARMFVYGSAEYAPGMGISTANLLQVNDQVDNSADGVYSAFLVLHRLGGGTTAGTKHTIEANLGVTGNVDGDDATGYKALVSMQASAYASANIGGDGGAVPYPPSGWRGGLFGGNDHPRLSAGATYWGSVAGREINVEIEAGASAWTKVGLWLVKGSNDVNRGTGVDGAIIITDNAANPAPWKAGLQFGNITGYWPFADDSVLIGTQHCLYPSSVGARALEADYGVDFRDVVFTSAAFASNQFKVLDTGEVQGFQFRVPDSVRTASAPIITGVQRWDNAAVAFTGWFMNIIETGYAGGSAGSLLFALQHDSVNEFIVNKFGEVRARVNFGVGITNTAILWPDANHHLGLRNGTNAQKMSIYYTFGDATNYARLSLVTAAAEMGLTAETLGAGPDNIDIAFVPAGTGLVKFGAYTAIGAETVDGFITVKDAAGNVRKLATVA